MTIYITELVTGLLVIAGLFIWGEGSVADWQIQSSFFRSFAGCWLYPAEKSIKTVIKKSKFSMGIQRTAQHG